MSAFLKFALAMDWISAQLGKLAAWAVLAASLISAGNAFVRYGLDFSSNAWLEIQWYLFAATVMLGAPLVLKLNEHVRVDIIYGKLKRNGPVYVDLFGLLFFLLPVMGLLFWLTLPFFLGMLTERRDVRQHRRPDPLAGRADDARGLRRRCSCRAWPR